MQLPELIQGTLIKRYKRFLADVQLEGGEQIAVHCPNTGAMTGCADPGNTVWLSTSSNEKRKYPQTWELAKNKAGEMICVHSAKANALVKEAIENKCIKELQGYDTIRTEVKYGKESSRIDFLLENNNGRCFVEVKSVTFLTKNGLGVFPDAVSTRGQKHLRELMEVKAEGCRAVLFFCVQHAGIESVAPADNIDPVYAETFRDALAAGVEVIAYGADITQWSIKLLKPLLVLDRQLD
jgi:sugar fermentation stimulation protein A